MEDHRLIPTWEAARLLGLAPKTLAIWRTRGAGPSFVKLGAAVRYACADLAEFIAERKHARTDDKSGSAAASQIQP